MSGRNDDFMRGYLGETPTTSEGWNGHWAAMAHREEEARIKRQMDEFRERQFSNTHRAPGEPVTAEGVAGFLIGLPIFAFISVAVWVPVFFLLKQFSMPDLLLFSLLGAALYTNIRATRLVLQTKAFGVIVSVLGGVLRFLFRAALLLLIVSVLYGALS